MIFQSNNIPKKLQPVIDKWNRQEKRYYLSPDNMFTYNGHKIMYQGGQDIPLSGWFACNGDIADDYALTKNDVEDIQHELLQYFQPFKWVLVLDWHCNYQCPMCPYHGDGVLEKENYYEDRGGQKRVVSKEEAFERIDRIVEYGVKTLSIMSQGEILLYPHWREVSEYAYNKGLVLWTITNGSLWTEDTVKEAASLGYTNIRVSLDALSFDTYAKIRSNRKDYYEKAMKLPELLMKYGIITNVHFVKQKENLHEVQSFLNYWKERKVDSISIANEFCYDGEVIVNKFAESEKEYIGGLCTAFGNMQTLANGNTQYCCGMDALMGEGQSRLEDAGCQINVSTAIDAMRTEYSDLRNLCRKCALYVPYNDEEVIDGWKVSRNYERETWVKMV